MKYLYTLFVISVLGLAGCEQDGPAERVGEDIDEAAESVQETAEEAADEMEEEMDEATN